LIIFSFSLAAAAEKYLHLVAIVIRDVPSVNQQPIRRRWKDAVENIYKIVGKDTVKSINKRMGVRLKANISKPSNLIPTLV
jgi:hypothetical protein